MLLLLPCDEDCFFLLYQYNTSNVRATLGSLGDGDTWLLISSWAARILFGRALSIDLRTQGGPAILGSIQHGASGRCRPEARCPFVPERK